MTMAPTNRVRVKAHDGKWLQTFVLWEGEWHVQAPLPARAPAVLPGAVSDSAVDAMVEAGANLAIEAIVEAVARVPGAQASSGLSVGVGELFDSTLGGDSAARNRRRLNSYPDLNGLIPLVPGNPISAAKLTPILDKLLALGVTEVSVEQLREIITARR